MASIFTKIVNGEIPSYKIAENDDFCGRQSLVSWSSEVGVLYYIYITGSTVSDGGSYTLQVSSEAPDFIRGNFCSNAIGLEVGVGPIHVPLQKANNDRDFRT